MTAGPDYGRAAFQSRVRPRLPAASGISTLTLVLRKKAISAYQGQRTLRVLEALISEGGYLDLNSIVFLSTISPT